MARIDCHAALASRVPNAGLQRNGLPNNEDCAGGPDLRGCGDRATPAESHGRCDYCQHSFKSREINEAAFRGVEMPLSGNEGHAILAHLAEHEAGVVVRAIQITH